MATKAPPSLSQHILGLHKALTDPESGAPIEFYRIVQYVVRPDAGTSQVTLQGYVSQASHALGKRALAFLTVELQQMPSGDGDALQWFYRQVPGAENAGALADAALVYEQTKPPAADPAT